MEEEPAPVSVRGHVCRGVISVQFNIISDLTAGTDNTGIKEQWGREVMDATMGRYSSRRFNQYGEYSLNKGKTWERSERRGCDGG